MFKKLENSSIVFQNDLAFLGRIGKSKFIRASRDQSFQVTDEMRTGTGGGLVAEGELIEIVEISVEEVLSNKFDGHVIKKLVRFTNI